VPKLRLKFFRNRVRGAAAIKTLSSGQPVTRPRRFCNQGITSVVPKWSL
jgi:hypothetical protein